MSMLLASLTAKKIISAFSWMLIHSLWQGLGIAVIAGVLLMLAKRSTAAFRYGILLILFMVFLTMCLLTFTWEWDVESASTISSQISGHNGINIPSFLFGNMANVSQIIKTCTDYFSVNAPFIVLIWFVFFLFKSVKMIGSVVYNQRVKNYRVFEPSEFWTDKIAVLSKNLNIKKTVKLLQSGYIKMPVVIGHIKPVILIPIGIMVSLPAEQVEAILLHELAHIRRSDYFINFLQTVAETMFFFNPALLWLSSTLRDERENCCDDIALQQSQNKQGFIEALVSFKEYELYGSSYATAFPGKKNQLMRRVSRILNNKNKTFGFGERIFFTAGLFVLGIALTTAMVAQLKAASKTTSNHRQYAVVYHIKSKVMPVKKADAMQARKIVESNTRAHINLKMRNGISGINRKEPERPSLSAISPVSVDLLTQQKVFSEKDQADQNRRDEIQARLDQIQAAKDQQQAQKDQAQALKDEIQAKIDQQHALADQAQAEKDRVVAIKAKKNIVAPISVKIMAKSNL